MRGRLSIVISALAALAALAVPTSGMAKVPATSGAATGRWVETYFGTPEPSAYYCIQRMEFTLVGTLRVGDHAWRGVARTPDSVLMEGCASTGALTSFRLSGSNGSSTLDGTCDGRYDMFGLGQLNSWITCTATVTDLNGGQTAGTLGFIMVTKMFADPTYGIADQCRAPLPCQDPPGNTTGARFVGIMAKR